MGKKVLNNVSAVDIQIVQATLIIPLAITIICSTFDILFHIHLKMTNCNTFNEWGSWVSTTLISYFFPSILALICSLLRQQYFTDNWSGIKEEKKLLLFFLTFIYFLLYIIYLLFLNTLFVYVFIAINIFYVLFVFKKCVNKKIFKKCSNRPKNKIKNAPSGEGQ